MVGSSRGVVTPAPFLLLSVSNETAEASPPLAAPLVADGEHMDATLCPSGAAPSATALLDALDAEADEGHEDEPLES